MSATLPDGSQRVEVRHVRRTLGLGALVWIMFFTVSGGAYGLEDTIGESGAGMGLLLILIAPIVWAIPAALVVAELATAMPVRGWVLLLGQEGPRPVLGLLEGWWSWLTSWVDMAIYPVLFVEYAAYFFPELFGEEGSPLYRWLLGRFGHLVLHSTSTSEARRSSAIHLASFRDHRPRPVRPARPSSPSSTGTSTPFQPFVNEGQGLAVGFRPRLFVVMWNYLGWDGVSTVAGEMKNPQRDYPQACC